MTYLKRFSAVTFFVFLSLLISIYGLYNYDQVADILQKQNNDSLERLIETFATQIDGSQLEKLKALSEVDDLYQTALGPLTKAHAPSRNQLRYVYTAYIKDDKIYFGLDTAPYEDVDKDGKIDHSQLNSPYDDAPKEIFEAYETKKLVISKQPYVDSYGTFVSAFRPIFDSKGEVVSVLAIDQTVEKNLEWTLILRNKIIYSFLFAELLVIILSIGTGRLIRMSELKNQTEEKLKQQEIALIQASKMTEMGLLTASITHEINNPLNVIGIHLSYLKKQALDEKLMKPIIKIEAATLRIQQTIKHIKNFVRKEKDEPERVDLKTLIVETLDFISVKIKTIEVIKEINDSAPIEVHPTQISQVLINLIVNAAEAMEDNKTPNPWIKIRTFWNEQNSICTEVSNAGPAISDELWKKINLGFFSTKEKDRGSGLGLMISRKIIENHNGSFHFSQKDGHTTFTIELKQYQKIENKAAV